MKSLAILLIITLALAGCARVLTNVGTIYKLDDKQYLVIETVDDKKGPDGGVQTTIEPSAIAVKGADGKWHPLDDLLLYQDLRSEGRYVRGIPDRLIIRGPDGSYRISNKHLDIATASTSDDKMKY